jgi:RNA polymerase sigma-70 factor (ECF subfamily)
VAAELPAGMVRSAARDAGLPRVLGRPAESVAEFQALYLEQFPALVRYGLRTVRDPDVARELAQEAFTRLLARWRDAADPGAYVFVIFTNLVRHHWRSLDRERGALRSLLVVGRRETEGPGRAGEVAAAVRDLPPALREPVLLHYFGDLLVEDVARALDRPVGTVKRQLYEGRALLRDSLREVWHG